MLSLAPGRLNLDRIQTAATVNDLAAAMADMLEDRNPLLPALDLLHYDASAFTRALITCNRAGFLTTAATLGLGDTAPSGRGRGSLVQRAAVTGFTSDPGIMAALRRASTDLGLPLLTRRIDDPHPREHGTLDVSHRDAEPEHVFGQSLDASDLHYLLDGTDTAAWPALTAAHQVTIAAPDFGPAGNLLFTDVLPMACGDGPACHHCGCTQNNACEQGCWWLSTRDRVPLCSSCTGHAAEHGIVLAA
jgi:uncharacterized protein DUF6919